MREAGYLFLKLVWGLSDPEASIRMDISITWLQADESRHPSQGGGVLRGLTRMHPCKITARAPSDAFWRGFPVLGGPIGMTKEQKARYEEHRAFTAGALNRVLAGRKFRLDCGHHFTFGHHLGNDITIYNGKHLKIMC